MELIDEVLAFLERCEYEIVFKRWTHAWGECDHGEKVITISSLAYYPVAVLLHELIHAVRPNWGEARVLRTELLLYNQLTCEDRRILESALELAGWKP